MEGFSTALLEACISDAALAAAKKAGIKSRIIELQSLEGLVARCEDIAGQ